MEKIKDFVSTNEVGSGSGYGSGSGDGFGSGDGSGDGIRSIRRQDVYQIDNVPTIITTVKRGIAKGTIVNSDLSLSPCYIAKGHGYFAHGKTARQAVEALQEKLFADMEPDEAIRLFLETFPDPDKKYPAKEFYIWHHRLTGSCEMGRNAFVKNGGYDLEHDTFTVREFIDITKAAYGGQIIRELEERLEESNGKL